MRQQDALTGGVDAVACQVAVLSDESGLVEPVGQGE